MKHNKSLIAALCVVALALGGATTASAQTKKAAAPATSPAAKTAVVSNGAAPMARAIPFHGTASSIDKSAKTFTLAGKTNSRVLKVTDKTTVMKAGTASTFAELNDNEAVSGSYWKHEDGTLEAKTLKIGGKTEAEKMTKKAKKGSSDTEGSDAAASPSPEKK